MMIQTMNNRQAWTVWLKTVVLAMILTTQALLTNAYGSEDRNFKIRIISAENTKSQSAKSLNPKIRLPGRAILNTHMKIVAESYW